jgi:hypothetical protein
MTFRPGRRVAVGPASTWRCQGEPVITQTPASMAASAAL